MGIKREFREIALPKRMALVITALTALMFVVTVLAASTASAAKTKSFAGQKNCSTAVTISPPAPGGYCLITQSSLKILLGAKVYYTDAKVVAGVVTSPVTLGAIDERGSTATGQCTYYQKALSPGSWPLRVFERDRYVGGVPCQSGSGATHQPGSFLAHGNVLVRS